MRILKSGRTWVLVTFAVFTVAFMLGWTWWEQQTPQAREYMLGRMAYRTTLYNVAVDYFDRSYADYLERISQKTDFFTAPGSIEMAQLSQHFKGLALIKMGNARLAVVTFKEALKLTTEHALSQLALSDGLLTKLNADRKNVQMNLEILYQNNPALARAEGKGKGAAGKEGDELKAAQDPSNTAGKTNRDKL